MNATNGGANLTSIMEEMYEKFKLIMTLGESMDKFQSMYWESIQYIPPSNSPASTNFSVASPSSNVPWKAGDIAGTEKPTQCLAHSAYVCNRG
jgi:hypothetical protein